MISKFPPEYYLASLILFFVLPSASRSLDIHNLNINFVVQLEDEYRFAISKLKPFISLCYCFCYPLDKSLCVIKTLDDYLTHQGQLRENTDISSFRTGWTKHFFGLLDIVINLFSFHFTSFTSTSKAEYSGISLLVIWKEVLSQKLLHGKEFTERKFSPLDRGKDKGNSFFGQGKGDKNFKTLTV